MDKKKHKEKVERSKAFKNKFNLLKDEVTNTKIKDEPPLQKNKYEAAGQVNGRISERVSQANWGNKKEIEDKPGMNTKGLKKHQRKESKPINAKEQDAVTVDVFTKSKII